MKTQRNEPGVLSRADIQNIRSAGYMALAGNFWHWQETCWELIFQTVADELRSDCKVGSEGAN